jgi:hypothetical protein
MKLRIISRKIAARSVNIHAESYNSRKIKNVGSGIDKETSDIMGGKWFGPVSMVGGVLSI